MILDNMVRNWLLLMVEDKLVVHEGLGLMVGGCLGLFYAVDCMVESIYSEWLQGSLNVLIGLFWR